MGKFLGSLAANAVDILIVSASRDGPPALATEILRHPCSLRSRTGPRVVMRTAMELRRAAVVEAIERLMQVGELCEAPAK